MCVCLFLCRSKARGNSSQICSPSVGLTLVKSAPRGGKCAASGVHCHSRFGVAHRKVLSISGCRDNENELAGGSKAGVRSTLPEFCKLGARRLASAPAAVFCRAGQLQWAGGGPALGLGMLGRAHTRDGAAAASSRGAVEQPKPSAPPTRSADLPPWPCRARFTSGDRRSAPHSTRTSSHGARD